MSSPSLRPTGSPIAVLAFDHRLFLWTPAAERVEARAPRLVATVPGKPERPEGGWGFGAFLAFSSTGERLLAGAGEGGAVLLDAAGVTIATASSLGGSWFFAPLAWSADGTRFAAAEGTTVRVFEARTGKALDAQVPPSKERVKCVALTSNGARLAIGTDEGYIREFDLATGALRWESELVDPWLGPGGGTRVGALGYSPDGAWLAATSEASIHGALYDPATGRQRWMGEFRGGRMGEPAGIAWAPDGRSWYLAYVWGVMPIGRVRVGDEVTEESLLRGSLPELGPRGLAVTVTGGQVVAFTTDPSRPTWKFRP